MLIELHTLTSHPPANLNRDDLGRPKTAFFGGVERARISSQSLKRAVRKSPYLRRMLGNRFATLSTRNLEDIYEELRTKLGEKHEKKLHNLAYTYVEVLGARDQKTGRELRTSQAIFLSPKEIKRIKDYFRDITSGKAELPKKPKGKNGKKKLLAMLAEAIGVNQNPGDALDLALFGRMTTSDASAFQAVEGSMQVAHPISTHAVATETDWFTAVDEVTEKLGETGSAHLNELEFNSAVFYKYFSCNLTTLLNNLNAKTKEDAKQAVDALALFLDAACRVTPTGKQNAFASNAVADTALLVLRPSGHPVSLANAFEAPIQANGQGYLASSRRELAKHYAALVTSYGLEDQAIFFSVTSPARNEAEQALPSGVKQAKSLGEVFDFLREHATSGVNMHEGLE